MLCLKVYDKNGKTVGVAHGDTEVNLVLDHVYEEGDTIHLETEGGSHYIWLQVDDAVGKSLVYTTGWVTYEVPFGEKRICCAPKAFSGERHLISARIAWPFELTSYRNLAVNVNDQHDIENCYPHATANVETRGESTFLAQNAIDGMCVDHCHGEWPYGSWGVVYDQDCRMKLDFGRVVRTDRIILYTRSDFPHDSWWTSVKVIFSDDTEMELNMEKSSGAHMFTFEPKDIRWLELCELKKAPDASPFPALTQIEVYGYDIVEE